MIDEARIQYLRSGAGSGRPWAGGSPVQCGSQGNDTMPRAAGLETAEGSAVNAIGDLKRAVWDNPNTTNCNAYACVYTRVCTKQAYKHSGDGGCGASTVNS